MNYSVIALMIAAALAVITWYLITNDLERKPNMLRVFQQTINLGPTLAANHTFVFKAPFDMQLVHVSCCNSTANAGTLKIGTTSDDDAYLLAENFGVSSTPVEVSTPAGFDGVTAGGQYPHILDDTLVLVTITDHVSHMANVMVVLTFTEG